uniref:Uncharacterized protein n=1 Tax=Parastrongyloides trichosuri TaxID=131310 RepID=A0A0N4Z5V5_PARTI
MIGMMNCNDASESVEFYCAPSTKKNSNDDDKKLFTEYKEKVHIEYRDDGRRMVDGTCEVKQGADKLWSDLIMRKTIDRNFSLSRDNDNVEEKNEEESKEKDDKKNNPENKCIKHEKNKCPCLKKKK